jgi:non-canonical poly(A) RNA polymerase PAPD5/7
MEFFRWVERSFTSETVVNFPDIGLAYLDSHRLPAGHPRGEANERISHFIRSLTPSPIDVAVRQQLIEILCRRIKDAVTPSSSFIIGPYGSCMNGTFLPEADIDLVLFYYPNPGNPDQIMDLLIRELEGISTEGSFQKIPHAKVPILKFTVGPAIQIDLTIDDLHGLLAIPAIRNIFRSFPCLLPAQLFLKCLLHKHKLDQPYFGGISSYALQILLLAYLQYKGEPESIIDFICGVCDFYGNDFNFTLTGIDVKGNGRFFSRYKEGRLALESPTTMHIIDPLNPRNILGHNAFKVTQIRQVFRETWAMLKENRVEELIGQFSQVIGDFSERRRLIAEYAKAHDIK